MKYIIIPIIALGFTLCSLFGVEYNCLGHEMFPTFYGSPFVFMQNNLGSSLEYYYSVSGLLVNVIVWSIPLFALHFLVEKLINHTAKPKLARVFYYSFVDVFVLFSLLNISMAYITLGRGFNENANYWYWNMDQEATTWGVKCSGEWSFIQLY